MSIKTLSLVLALTLFASCSSKTTKQSASPSASTHKVVRPAVESPSMEAKQLANELQTNLVTEFAFKKGSEELSPASKEKLKDISKKALAKGKIEVIKVISWADEEYPSSDKKKLSKDQMDLAHNRNEEIRNYINQIYPDEKFSGDIQLISMAQRPGYLKSLMSTDDAKIKKSLETSGIPTTAAPAKTGGKSSKSIVLILMKDQTK